MQFFKNPLMKSTKPYILFSAATAFLVTALCACGDDDPVDPIGELRPEHVECSANVAYSEHWVQSGDKVWADVDVSVNTPGDAKVVSLRVAVDGTEIKEYPYPPEEPLSYDAASFGHGRHTMKIFVGVSRGTQRVEVAPIEDFNFVVFDKKPVYTTTATVDVALSSKSSSGETFERNFKLKSNDKGHIPFAKKDFTWRPTTGRAPLFDVEMSIVPQVDGLPDALKYEIKDLFWNIPDSVSVSGRNVKLKWSNPVTIQDFNGVNSSFGLHIEGRHEDVPLSETIKYRFPLNMENDKVEL